MKTSYYKDYRHNYLIIECENAEDLYQRRMITENQIEGLIPCRERHVNGDVYLYYEITSKQNLRSLYEGRHISMMQLKKFFVQLRTVEEKISGFMLDEYKLILKPEYIYADVETEELLFLYYPFAPEENNMIPFLEFLTEKVDNEDQTAVETAYKMLELASREQFVLDEVVEWFEDDYEYEKRRDPVMPKIPEEDITCPVPEPCVEEKKTKSGNRVAFVGVTVSALIFILLFYIHTVYLVSEKVQICLYGGLLFSAMLFLGSICILIYQKLFDGKDLGESIRTRLWKKEEEPEEMYREIDDSDRLQEKMQQTYGNTIFIPWTENCENKLYGVGKGNKNHMDLSRLPMTVGKLAGSVDVVIEDQSISRRHARFFRDGNKVYMSDLNSTNGSFKNGMRLLPNASEVLEPGDEIRLGKLKFIYR